MTSLEAVTPSDLGRSVYDSNDTRILNAAFERAWVFVESIPLKPSRRHNTVMRSYCSAALSIVATSLCYGSFGCGCAAPVAPPTFRILLGLEPSKSARRTILLPARPQSHERRRNAGLKLLACYSLV